MGSVVSAILKPVTQVLQAVGLAPKTPDVPPPPPPPKEVPAPAAPAAPEVPQFTGEGTKETIAAKAAAEEKRKLAARRGRASTILTSPLGVTGDATASARKTLLGQ